MKYLNWDDEKFFTTNYKKSNIALSNKDNDDVSDTIDYLNSHKNDKHYVWIVTERDPYGALVETEFALYERGEDAYKRALEYSDEATFDYAERSVLEYANYAASLEDLLDFTTKTKHKDEHEEEQFDYNYADANYGLSNYRKS